MGVHHQNLGLVAVQLDVKGQPPAAAAAASAAETRVLFLMLPARRRMVLAAAALGIGLFGHRGSVGRAVPAPLAAPQNTPGCPARRQQRRLAPGFGFRPGKGDGLGAGGGLQHLGLPAGPP